MPESLKLLSYNICHGCGLDMLVDISRAASVINDLHPDFVALQEIDVNVPRSNSIDEMAELSRLTGMHPFFGKAIDLNGGAYGVGILSRLPGKIVCHRQLPGYEMRTLLGIESITAAGNPIRFYCTHFPLKPDLRLISAGILAEEINSCKVPTAVMGDFNCQPDEFAWKLMASMMQAANGANWLLTFSSDKPRIAIDHCFFKHGCEWSAISASVVCTPNISDHNPLLVTASLNV